MSALMWMLLYGFFFFFFFFFLIVFYFNSVNDSLNYNFSAGCQVCIGLNFFW